MKTQKFVRNESLVPIERIQKRIYVIRGRKIMLDSDLAELYDVETKALNQAVKRNMSRFPDDFMFQLTKDEKNQVVTNCDHLTRLKYSSVLPYAFTEQGIAMLSSVLRSERAIEINIAIMRVFVHLRQVLADNAALRKKLEEHDEQIKYIFNLLGQMLEEPEESKKQIGFITEMGRYDKRR